MNRERDIGIYNGDELPLKPTLALALSGEYSCVRGAFLASLCFARASLTVLPVYDHSGAECFDGERFRGFSCTDSDLIARLFFSNLSRRFLSLRKNSST